MLSMNNLRPGMAIMLHGEPYYVASARHFKTAQRRPVMQTKLRNIKTEKVLEHTFQQSDKIEEADIETCAALFHYRTKNEFFFTAKNGTSYCFTRDDLGSLTDYLVKGLEVAIMLFQGEPIKVEVPIKVVLRVKQAPPGIKGNTASGATKEVTLETDGTVKTPLFIEAGDMIEVNTQTGKYLRRVNA